MRKLRIKHIDAFTDRPYTGNPAAVIMEADGLTDAEMQRIAREMNLSETAFIFKPKDSSYDLEVRWMTPTVEVNLCGHATIASFHALMEEGLYGLDKKDDKLFRLKTKSGILPVKIEHQTVATTETHNPTIRFGLPLPKFKEYHGQKFDLCNALSVSMELLDKKLPIWVTETGTAFIPFATLASITKLKPNFKDLFHLAARLKLTGYCVFSTETKHPSSSAHARYFTPTHGIDEDPVTGSAQGQLACYLYLNGIVKGEGTFNITLEQGYAIDRGGRVWAELKTVEKQITSLTIGGYAITILNGEIMI
jgi:trans-2,3-dihydro-3-hydroxyanthranilate isomerase